MNRPLVSVIVPCYKQAHLVSQTLDSVLNQSYKNWECIVVNDGSPDNTSEVVNTYVSKDSRFHLLEQENQGLAMSRNNGIRLSNGKYILPLDSDDLIEPTYLEKAVKYHEENPDTKVVYCKADRFDQKNESWDLPDYKYEDEIWTNRIFCSAVYKRCDYDKTIGYNPNMKGGYEDWDFWLSLLDRDSKVYRIPEVLFHYRFQRNSMVTKSDTMRHELYRKIYHNHPHIYEDYIQDIILYKNTLIEQDKVVNTKIVKVLRKIYGIMSTARKRFVTNKSGGGYSSIVTQSAFLCNRRAA